MRTRPRPAIPGTVDLVIPPISAVVFVDATPRKLRVTPCLGELQKASVGHGLVGRARKRYYHPLFFVEVAIMPCLSGVLDTG